MKRSVSSAMPFNVLEAVTVGLVIGLVVAVVMFVLPVMQRNERNARRLTDADRLATVVRDYIEENQQLPITVVAGATTNEGQAVAVDYSLFAYYDDGIQIKEADRPDQIATTTSEMIVLRGAYCEDNRLSTDFNPQAFAVSYRIETSASENIGVARCV